MAEYFTSDHFKLLNKWQGQKRDESNPEQNRAYDELKKAYEVAERWAHEVQQRLFPAGHVKIRKRPTSQANVFFPYNWARIYPTKSSPNILAYTVGINPNDGFVVKIDTVQADPELRGIYEKVRGPMGDSPIVAFLPESEGLGKSLSELVDWSIEAINKFKISYLDLALMLGLMTGDDPEAVLNHFRGHQYFKERSSRWKPDLMELFCRFVIAVHDAQLDIWVTRPLSTMQKFGRKEETAKKGRISGRISLRYDGIDVWWDIPGSLGKVTWAPLTAELVKKLEKAGDIPKPISNRIAYWPDDYVFSDADEEDDEERSKKRKAFNRIYYGPPGTGKTYQLLKLLKDNYTDDLANQDPESWLVEQVRELNWFQIIALVLLEAKKPIKVADIVGHSFYQAKAKANGRTKNLSQNAWGYLQRHTWIKSTTVDYAKEKRAEIAVFDKDENSNWFVVSDLKEQLTDLLPVLAQLKAGPEPGAVNKRYVFVTFHQSYGYEEFVEGLRPELGADATDQVRYDIPHGALRKLCTQAESDPDNFYAMVIDEINRGNISKIFGELITLIETDKRTGAELAVPLTLPYSGDAFIIPPNVDFIGSMNTADRSLALVDTALRRRFEFVPILPDPKVLAGVEIAESEITIDLQQLLVVINNRIEALYDRDHTIGHAYFTHIENLDPAERFSSLKSAFKNKIIPLLEEYFFEDWQKIRLVLGDNQKSLEFQFIEEVNREEDLVNLFGQHHELDQYAVRSRYRLNEASFDLPQTYVGIYTPAGK